MEPDTTLKHTKHIFRVSILLAFVLVALVLSRDLFVPESWGEYGWYRGNAVLEHSQHTVVLQGDVACGECHEDEYDLKAAGGHTTVRCELCHAPYPQHIADGEVIAEMPIPESYELCTRCHRFLAARPEGFPQVNPQQHLADNEVEFSDTVCTECHDPHSPL